MSAFVSRYLGKVDIVCHPKGVEVYAKLINLGRPLEQRCCLVHLHMFTLYDEFFTNLTDCDKSRIVY